MSAVAYLVDTLVWARRILREQPRSGRGSLLLLYFKIRTKLLCRRFLQDSSLRKEVIFGFPVECTDYGSLVFVFEEVFVRRDYEFVAASDRPLVLDCGSNIGLALLFFKRLYPEARVIAFEPSAVTFELLARNVSANGLNGVELHNVALHEAAGERTLYEDTAHPGSGKNSLYADRAGGSPSRVKAMPLSEFVRERVDFLKMDIEGAEEGVLQELAQSGRLKLVQQMVIEYHHHINPREDRLSHILRLMEENGFGYQLRVAPDESFSRETFQDLLIYAYQK